MSTHLTAEGLLDALEDRGGDRARRHLEECGSCRELLREARQGLALADAGGAVPEPPPLFWDSFRRQVGRRLAEEAPAPWRRVFDVRILLPAAAAVALLVALLPSGRGPVAPSPVPALPAWEALPADDSGLDVLEGLAQGGGDLEGAAGCLDVAECLSGLSDDESLELAEALREAWPEARS